MKYLQGNLALHFTDDDMSPENGAGKTISLISDSEKIQIKSLLKAATM